MNFETSAGEHIRADLIDYDVSGGGETRHRLAAKAVSCYVNCYTNARFDPALIPLSRDFDTLNCKKEAGFQVVAMRMKT